MLVAGAGWRRAISSAMRGVRRASPRRGAAASACPPGAPPAGGASPDSTSGMRAWYALPMRGSRLGGWKRACQWRGWRQEQVRMVWCAAGGRAHRSYECSGKPERVTVASSFRSASSPDVVAARPTRRGARAPACGSPDAAGVGRARLRAWRAASRSCVAAASRLPPRTPPWASGRRPEVRAADRSQASASWRRCVSGAVSCAKSGGTSARDVSPRPPERPGSVPRPPCGRPPGSMVRQYEGQQAAEARDR